MGPAIIKLPMNLAAAFKFWVEVLRKEIGKRIGITHNFVFLREKSGVPFTGKAFSTYIQKQFHHCMGIKMNLQKMRRLFAGGVFLLHFIWHCRILDFPAYTCAIKDNRQWKWLATSMMTSERMIHRVYAAAAEKQRSFQEVYLLVELHFFHHFSHQADNFIGSQLRKGRRMNGIDY